MLERRIAGEGRSMQPQRRAFMVESTGTRCRPGIAVVVEPALRYQRTAYPRLVLVIVGEHGAAVTM